MGYAKYMEDNQRIALERVEARNDKLTQYDQNHCNAEANAYWPRSAGHSTEASVSYARSKFFAQRGQNY